MNNFKKVIENYFGEKLEIEILTSISNNKKRKRDEAYSLISFFIDLILTLSELGILTLKDSKILESFKFKANWLTADRLNKNSLRFLFKFFETEKNIDFDLSKKFLTSIEEVRKMGYLSRGNPYSLYEWVSRADLTEKYKNISEAVFYEFTASILEKIIKEIQNEKLHLILIKRPLKVSEKGNFEDKFFKIANPHSCMRYGGCFNFYNNTEIEIYPCVIIDNKNKIRGRILYAPNYKVFFNGYEPNQGSYHWIELVSKYFDTNENDLCKENISNGFVSNTHRIYIDFIISKNWFDADHFLDIFNCVSCCICGYSMNEDEAYVLNENIYCEDCFYTHHRYCDTCDEYHNINEIEMVYIPSHDIYTCNFQIIS